MDLEQLKAYFDMKFENVSREMAPESQPPVLKQKGNQEQLPVHAGSGSSALVPIDAGSVGSCLSTPCVVSEGSLGGLRLIRRRMK